MEISEIKQQLSLAQVLNYYHLKPDKNLRLHCPFHEDKTPSMQVYHKTHTCYCFSSNCKTHGKSMDVVDFMMHKENLSKHEAIKRCEAMINGEGQPSGSPLMTKAMFLHNMFIYFRNAVYNSRPAQEYISSRKLNFSSLEIGYNTGQFHHGRRRQEKLIEQCLQYGLLNDTGMIGKTGEKAHRVFGKSCIVFALRDSETKSPGCTSVPSWILKMRNTFILKTGAAFILGIPNPVLKN
jgi:DNA primase